MKIRIDHLLFQLNLAESRSKAQHLVEEKRVKVNGCLVTKPSLKFQQDVKIEVLEGQDFVGRGANKLDHALYNFDIEVKDKLCLDVGASTGGFTEVLLLNHAKKVLAVDVGKEQLVKKLKEDSRVESFEETHISSFEYPEKVDLIVVDVSFISLLKIMEKLNSMLVANGMMVLLYKPQFEVGKKFLGKNGVVKDQEAVLKVLEEFYNFCQELKIRIRGICKSPIKGKKGNTEFLIHIDHGEKESIALDSFLSAVKLD